MTVCFTGHRDLGSEETQRQLRNALDTQIKHLIEKGATTFLAGGALGFDTMAAEAVLDARAQHPNIRLELLLPCQNQSARWNEAQIRRYNAILSRADNYTYISPFYFQGVMHKRNRALVDSSALCIAFLREGERGGTAYTVGYATQKGIPVINLAKKP